MEQPRVQSDVTGDHSRGAGNPMTGSVSLACSSLVGDDASLEALIQLTVTPHKISKGNGADGKSEDNISTKIDNSPVTHSSRSEAAEEKQWVKMHDQVLGKAPNEVNPLSKSTFPISSSVSNFLVSEEDIPPGFGGQLKSFVMVSKDSASLGGSMGNYVHLGQTSSGSLSSPSFSSNGPSYVSTRADPALDPSVFGHVLEHSVLVTPQVSLGPQLADISNIQHTKHVSHASGPKWSRVLCSSHGNKEALLPLAGQKRGFRVDSI